MSSRWLHTPRHLQRVWDQFVQKESLEQSCLNSCTLPDTSRECGTSSSRRNLWSNVIWMAAHSQTPPESVGPVHLEGISRAISSGWLHTPRHLQRVWDQFVQKESPEQSHLDGCTLPDTSRECGTSLSRRNLWSNVIWTAAHSQTPPESVGPVRPEGISGAMSSGWLHAHTSRECGTSSSRRNLWSNVVQMAARTQTPPESVGPVPLEGISRAILSGWLHTPRHLQRVWHQFLQKESLEQSRPDGCTLPDTSRECGTSSPGRNLWSNLVWTAAHSQTPPESVGQVPPEGISGAMSSRWLHTPRHLQRVWDQFPQKESPEQSHPDGCTLPDTSRECGTSSSRRNLQSNLVQTAAHS